MSNSTQSEIVLEVKGVSKRFGGLQALSDVGITIERGQVYASARNAPRKSSRS